MQQRSFTRSFKKVLFTALKYKKSLTEIFIYLYKICVQTIAIELYKKKQTETIFLH